MNMKEKSIFTPTFDSFRLRNTYNNTKHVIKHEKLTQIYNGPIVKGCYHGLGLIIWVQENEKQIYEGYFYVNQIHGYGRMIYGNGLIFEGLFKDNMRFGPGVMTYPNQFQEVGFWIGSHIFRLTYNLTTHLVPSYILPNVSSKIKLLQFRHLIDLTRLPHSITNIRDNNEKYLNINYSCPAYIRHFNSLFFDSIKFDVEFTSYKTIISENNNIQIKKNNRFIHGYDLVNLIQNNYLVNKNNKETLQSNDEFLSNCSMRIDEQYEIMNDKSWSIISNINDNIQSKHLKSNEKKNENDPHEIISNDYNFTKILAYNNNTLDKIILAHAYQQQFGEKILLYDIDDVWSGKRNRFMPSCSHELEAVKFLTKLDLNPENIQHIIQNYDIDLDVADSRGNTRLMISSANDQHEIIECLINLGADLECFNDDGFTPLNLTIMRYICLLNNIEHWTEYFIPHVNLKFNLIKENQHITLNNIQKINFFQPENLKNMKFTENDNDVEEMNSTTILTATKKQILLDSAESTILLLINMGAKATTCVVPKISIHLALLTINSNILKAVFEAGGSSAYTLSNENYKLNLLHMAVMIPTNYNVVQCIKVLIMHCVNPNLKALPMFSIFRYELPWIKMTNENNASITPLDILCLKENIYELDEELTVDEKSESELASMLYDVTDKSHTYCGFEPIVLAMLTGKLHLTKTFLGKNKSIVSKIISGFGTLLSLLLNPSYNFNLSNTKLNKLLDLLLKANSNPLKIIKIFDMKFRGNVCEYYSNLSESEKLNKVTHPSRYSNIEIKKKLRNSGREILDTIYSKKATVALLNDYRKNITTPLSVDEKMAMLVWLNLGNKILTHRAKIVKMSNNQLFKFRTVKNNKFDIKEKMKNEIYTLCLQHIQSTAHKPIILTKEESRVCYECLQHQSKDNMEACSSCYFALLCSESCKNQHNKENNCKLQMSKEYIIQIQNELNNNINIKKSNISSTNFNSTEKSRVNSEKLESNEYISLSSVSLHSSKSFLSITHLRSSHFSKITDNLSLDDASNYSKQSRKKVNDITHSRKYKKNQFKVGSSYSRNSKIYNSVSSEISNRISIRSSSNDLDYDKKNYSHSDIGVIIEDTQKYTEDDSEFMQSNQSKQFKQSNQSKNKVININHSKKYKKSDFESGSNYSKTNKTDSSVSLQNTNSRVSIQSNGLDYDKKNYIHTDSMVKFQNKNKRNDRKSGQKITRNRDRKLILNNKLNIPTSSMKYKTVRSPGCWIPIFMFINRGTYEDVTTLKNVISSGMSYSLTIEKNEQVYSNINDNQYDMLNNYSLI